MATAKKSAADRRKATEAKAKGAQTQALRVLVNVAKEINHRLAKAEKLEGDVTDNRLAAALQLAAAKAKCKKTKLNFKQWCEDNITFAPDKLRQLTAVGCSPNPKLAIEDLRFRNKKAVAKHREKVAVEKAATVAKAQAETPFTRAKTAFAAMKDEETVKVLASLADSNGLAVVTKDQAKAAKQAGETLKYGPFEQIKKLFDKANNGEKMKIVNYVVGAVGATLATGFEEPTEAPADDDDDLLKIPDSLRRKPAAKGTRRKKAATS